MIKPVSRLPLHLMLSLLSGMHSEYHQNFEFHDADDMNRVFCRLPLFYRIARYHVPQESCCHICFLFYVISFFSLFFLSSSPSVSLLHIQVHVCIVQAKEVIKSLAMCIAYSSDCTSITKYCEYIVIGLET